MLKGPQLRCNHTRQFSSEHRARTWREFKRDDKKRARHLVSRRMNRPRGFFFKIIQPFLLAAILDGVVDFGDPFRDAVWVFLVVMWVPLLHMRVVRLSATKLSVQGHRVLTITVTANSVKVKGRS